MISKINKIKKLPLVFNDFRWKSGLPPFKTYNLIYGWNGTGKTTLSRLFGAFEHGTLNSCPEVEYEIEDNSSLKYMQGEAFNKKIRVFNKNYIDNNIRIQDSKAKAITLILGDANKEVVEQIESDEKELENKNLELKKFNDLLEQQNKTKNKTFTEIAKTIYVAIMGGAIRTYRKDNAESDFASLSQKLLLVDEELNTLSIAVKQNSKPQIETIKDIEIEIDNNKKKSLAEALIENISDAKALLLQTVESQVIDRLKDNQDISDWIESGLAIHTKHSSSTCEFCGQTLPKDRLSELLEHFNDADKKLKEDVDHLAASCEKIIHSIETLKYPDKSRLFDELQEDYESKCDSFDQNKDAIVGAIKGFKDEIAGKKAKTTEAITLSVDIDTQPFTVSLRIISSILETHNKKSADFENEKSKAVKKLKEHYLSTIFDEVKALEEEIKNLTEAINKLQNGDATSIGIKGLRKRISENQAKISSTRKACEDINKGLETFLCRNELVFEPQIKTIVDENGQKKEIDDGYLIKRNGELADNLSEGEKTAIAFVYFTIHLKEQDFDLKSGIVVVDDPISSLDSASLFQAFAFLKNAVKEAAQVFILTHNFEFLKLVINWLKHDGGNKAGYYMIKNCHDNGCRSAELDLMDKELYKYESEYHYLFKKLKEFRSDGTIAQSYPIPNIARKVLDTFLLFRVPTGVSPYKKLEKIKETTSFDENKLAAIYKFTNDQSHITGSGFDPALVPETQKNVQYLLEMIKEVFPEHYKLLDESTN